jgi:CTP-dependent riboflavin kinase
VAKSRLRGRVTNGFGDAKNWGIEQIRALTAYDSLQRGTLNVVLDVPHTLRSDFRLPRERRTDGRNEDLDFERCLVVGSSGDSVRALIARTSTNAWGDSVLEIMAEEILRVRLGLQEASAVEVVVWVGSNAAAEAESETGSTT